MLRLLALLIFGSVGIGASLVGYHDIFIADAPLDRLFALPLLAVGLLSAVAAAGYLRGRSWVPRLAAVVSVTTAALAIYLISGIPLRGSMWTPRLFLLTAALLMPLLYWLYDTKSLRREPMAMFSGLGRAGTGLAVAGIIAGIGQGWYTTQYLPSTIPVALNMTIQMTKLAPPTAIDVGSRPSPSVAIELAIHIRNITNTRIQTVASVFHVQGVHLSQASLADSAWADQMAADLGTTQEITQPTSRYGQPQQTTVVETGEMFQPFSWTFEPGEETVQTYVVFVPTGTYQVLKADATIYAAQSTNVAVDEIKNQQGPQLQHNDTTRWVQTTVEIDQSSWFQKLTSPRDGLAVQYVTWEVKPNSQYGAYPVLGVFSWDPAGGSATLLNPEELKKFGIAGTVAATVLEL